MAHATLFVEQADRLCTHDLAARSYDFIDADQGVWSAASLHGALGCLLDDVRGHVAAEVALNHHIVGVKVIMRAHHCVAPLARTAGYGAVSQDAETAIGQARRDDDADFVRAA